MTATRAAGSNPGVPEVPSYGAQILQGLLALGAVCLLAWVSLRWWSRRLGAGFERPGPLRVVARLPLEPRRTLYVIDAAGRYLLVGVADSGMTTLGELPPEAVERALAAAPAPKNLLALLGWGKKHE